MIYRQVVVVDTDYSVMDNKDLYDQLNKAGLIDKLATSPEWKMLQEAANRIVERAIKEFSCSTKANNIVRIIELQTIIRKYKYGLIDEVNILKNESEFIYQEAKFRGLIGEAWDKLKDKFAPVR